MKKSLYFFCQMLAVGGAITHTLSLTPTEAEQHRAELAKGDGIRKVYMTPISFGAWL